MPVRCGRDLYSFGKVYGRLGAWSSSRSDTFRSTLFTRPDTLSASLHTTKAHHNRAGLIMLPAAGGLLASLPIAVLEIRPDDMRGSTAQSPHGCMLHR